MGKTVIWTILNFSCCSRLNIGDQQKVKLVSSNVVGLQHSIGGERKF